MNCHNAKISDVAVPPLRPPPPPRPRRTGEAVCVLALLFSGGKGNSDLTVVASLADPSASHAVGVDDQGLSP